jgi:hypothetical protein
VLYGDLLEFEEDLVSGRLAARLEQVLAAKTRT